jgi:hypothetical protein
MMRGHYGEWPEAYVANRGSEAGKRIDPIDEVIDDIARGDLTLEESDAIITAARKGSGR